jgi:hypothetical protein
MALGMCFHKNVHVEFKKDMGVMFGERVEVKALVVKVEETKKASKLMSKDGKSFITGASDFPELEEIFHRKWKVNMQGRRKSVGAGLERTQF